MKHKSLKGRCVNENCPYLERERERRQMVLQEIEEMINSPERR